MGYLIPCDGFALVRRVAVTRGGHLAILRSGLGNEGESEVAVVDIVPVPGDSFEQTLTAASPDMLREMIRAFAQKMMDAEVETACGAGYGEVSPDRVNSRNGYRPREWDTRAGTVELAIPKLRHGTYFPSFLEHRRRAERALASVVATSLPAGRLDAAGGEARRVPRRHGAEQVAGQRDGRRARRAGRGVPVPPARRRPLHLRVDRRADAEGPRGRPDGERALPGRDRGQRGRAPGDPRRRRDQLRGRGRAGWRSCAAWSPAAWPAWPW